MKKTTLLLLTMSAISLTGCLQMFPATVVDMGQGIYNLNVQSNAFGSRSALTTKLERKAEAICNGKGFEKINQSNTTNHDTVISQGIFIPVSSKSNSLTIKCKD